MSLLPLDNSSRAVIKRSEVLSEAKEIATSNAISNTKNTDNPPSINFRKLLDIIFNYRVLRLLLDTKKYPPEKDNNPNNAVNTTGGKGEPDGETGFVPTVNENGIVKP